MAFYKGKHLHLGHVGITFILFFIFLSAQPVFSFCKTPTPVFESDIHVLSAHQMIAMVHDRYIIVLTDANYIQVMDTDEPSLGKAFVHEIQLPGSPRDAAFDPASPDRVYFLIKDKIVRLDTTLPHPLAWSLNGEAELNGLGMAISFKGASPSFVAVGVLGEDGLSVERFHAEDLSPLSPSFPIDNSGLISDLEVTDSALYVLLETTGQILQLQTETGKLLTEGDAGSSPIGMALDKVRNQLLIANPTTHTITILDAETLVLKSSLKDENLMTAPVAISISGDTAYIGGGEFRSTVMPLLLDSLMYSGESVSISDPLKDGYVHPEKNTLYLASAKGVYYTFDESCLRVMVQQRQDLWTPKVEILLSPEESFGLRMEGGSPPFTIQEGAGLSCTLDEADDQGRTYSCLIKGENDYPIVVEDASGYTRTILARVAPSLSASPSDPDVFHVGGDPLTFSAIGGFPPVTWQTESGMLSSTTGRTVVYFPPDTAGYDRISITDRTGTSVDIPITVELSGLAITPAQALLFPGESKTFTAVGSNSTEFEWITTQGTVDWIGNAAVFTADTIGDVELIVRDKHSEIQTGLAKIWVVQEELSISPNEVVLGREEGQLFRVSGGKGLYTWTSERGDLSASQGDSVFLTTPVISGAFSVAVSDKTGRIASASITGEGDMYISPVKVVAKPEEEIKFSLVNVHGTPSFQAESGYFLKTDNRQALYKAPPQSGTFDIQMTDERGLTAFARVRVTGPDLHVQPGYDAITSGGSKLLTAVGGIGPWYWHAEQGLLSSVQGRTVRYLAPSIDKISRIVEIEVTDSMGSVSITTLTVFQNETIAAEQFPSLFTINPGRLVLPKSGSRSLTLLGGMPPYQITGFGDHITTTLSEEKLYVSASATTGTSHVEAMDAQGRISRADIQIYNELTLSHTRLTLPINGEETFSILGGLPPYDLIQSDEDGSFTHTQTGDNHVVLKGVTLGRSHLIIRDQAQSTATLSISITSETLRVSPETIDAVIGETIVMTVTGGNGGYTYQAQEGSITPSGLGQFLYTVPNHTGNFTVSFFDKNEREVTVPVSVRDDFLAVTPSRLLLLPGEATLLSIIKGRPPYVVTAEKGESLLNEDQIIFTAPSETGSFDLSVRDESGKSVQATIQVLSSISLTPAIHFATPGESLIISAQGGAGTYTFTAESGEFLEIHEGRAIFKCPERVGHYGITVSDSLSYKATSLVMVGDVPQRISGLRVLKQE